MSFSPDGRRNRRIALCYPAWLEGHGGRLIPCTVANIAEDGAQLCISENIVLPSRFALWLTRNGQTKRFCRLIWRKAERLGVRFVVLPRERSATTTVFVD